HVCYRFWKDGVQIDPYSEIGRESLPMPTDQIQDYLEYIHSLKKKLDAIEIQ
ncbi:MAG TPA: peptidase M23, partial [Bacteroidetes bacterium]|nr:peptidase M23 [Bacteroidota bacterium]